MTAFWFYRWLLIVLQYLEGTSCQVSPDVWFCFFFFVLELKSLHVYMCRIYGSRRNLSNCVRASEEDREKAYEKAEKLLLDLESEYPTFVKSMLPSHVSGGFWLVSCSLLVSYACYFYVHLCSLFLNFCSLSLNTTSNLFLLHATSNL